MLVKKEGFKLMTDEQLIAGGFIIGLMMGFLIAICIIDDMESFRLPGTNKVYTRTIVELP